jgi:hypothetical protein
LGSPRAVGRGSLGLGPFLNELESRLRALSAQEMSAALLAHAECLPARERASFLAVFTSVEPPSGDGEGGVGRGLVRRRRRRDAARGHQGV